jgi:hypothetical protein
MYVKKLRLQNIKCFEELVLDFRARDGSYAGWNVILGENGRGKSTILRSIALTALSQNDAVVAARQHAGHFVRQGAQGASQVAAGLLFHEPELEPSGAMTNRPYQRTFDFDPQGDVLLDMNRHTIPSPPLEGTLRHALCYGYGPFRRLGETPSSVPSAFQFPAPLSRFVTLFSDGIGLADATRGLIDLYVASIDPGHTAHHAARQALAGVREVVNASLPGGVQLERVTSEAVRFKTAGALELTEKELSDGYRSFLAIVFDLLRQLSVQFGAAFPSMVERHRDQVAVNAAAVVLIDEADAHLHPRVQTTPLKSWRCLAV